MYKMMFRSKNVTKIHLYLYLCYIQYFNFHFVSIDFREGGLYGISPCYIKGGLYGIKLPSNGVI